MSAPKCPICSKTMVKMVKLPQESSGGNVGDGVRDLKSAVDQILPDISIQCCTFHAFNQERKKTTLFSRLSAGRELLGIARTLLKVESEQQALAWLRSYFDWCEKWEEFLKEKSYSQGVRVYIHQCLREVKSSLNRLINSGHLFTYLDPILTLDGYLPSTNNRIEGGVNAQLREMLRLHRGLSTTREI